MSPSTENIKLNQPASRYQCVGWYQIERKKVGDKFLYFFVFRNVSFYWSVAEFIEYLLP